MKGDKQLRQERGYHGKSYVRSDGSEVLLDKVDWDVRKRELWDRAKGKCEYPGCGSDGWVPSHIIPRYPVRDDRMSNLKLYCGYHDRLTEQQKWRKVRFGEGQKPIEKRRRGARQNQPN